MRWLHQDRLKIWLSHVFHDDDRILVLISEDTMYLQEVQTQNVMKQ